MELSFQSQALREYWTDPAVGDLMADEVEAGKQVLEDLAAAANLEDLNFLYDLEYNAGTVEFYAHERVTVTCQVDASRVRTENDRVDLSRANRVKLLSIEKLGDAS